MRPFSQKTLSILCLVSGLIAAEPSDPAPPAIGNFALPLSQQPGPLISFGQNVLGQGQIQLYLFADAFLGKNNYFTDVFPSILYGITDNLSFFFVAPFSPGNQDRKQHSAGMEDISAQFEYIFYATQSANSADQATVVASVTFPTGSSSKNPPTGYGATSFFIGATFNHMMIDWFFFTSPGAILTTPHHGSQFGNQFLYQFGFGRNIPSPSHWIIAWMIELDGQYSWKNKVKGTLDSDSGGNVIYATPSIWISSDRIILQLGAGYPIVQHLFGNQSKQYVAIDFDLGITF